MKTFLIACAYMRKYYNFKNTKFRREVIKVLLRPEYAINNSPKPL